VPKLKFSIQVFCLALAAMLVYGSAMAVTYRWVDENGKVQYGDVMPPAQAGRGHSELDKHGRVIKQIKRSRLTADELEHQQALTAREAEEKRKQEVLYRRDKALLATYTSEEEIELARKRAIELENLNIRGLQTRLDASAAKLAAANTLLRQAQAAGGKAPSGHLQMRDEAQGELTQISELLRQRNQAIKDIQLRFDEDVKRFIELKASMR
jgi:hypothetical protein